MNGLFYTLLILLLSLTTNAWAATGISGDVQIDRCEQKSYVITLSNTSGNDIDSLFVSNDLSGLSGFSFVPSTSILTAPTCSTTGIGRPPKRTFGDPSRSIPSIQPPITGTPSFSY